MKIAQHPGLKTVADHSAERLHAFSAAGFEWITFQAQNGGLTRDFDLGPAKHAGLSAGVWGVTYDASRFRVDGFALGAQAKKLGAEHVTMDVEMAAKQTRATRGMLPIIDGIRAGGWLGPVNLNTMGPPHNPDVNDYEMDLVSFLETGGGVMTQAYFNETNAFHPALAVKYWLRVGVPAEALNLTVSLYPAEADKEKPGTMIPASEWVKILRDTWSRSRQFSVFMAEAMSLSDMTAFQQLSAPPPDQPSVDVDANRLESIRLNKQTIDHWRRSGLSEAAVQIQRQTLSWRVQHLLQSGVNLRAVRDLLDRLQAPRP